MKARSLRQIVDAALAEDVGPGDVTGQVLFPANARARAILVARSKGVLAGMEAARLVFRRLDPRCRWQARRRDGEALMQDLIVATVVGKVRALLAAERTALNFLQRLSGIATISREFVRLAPGTVILDTRKTTPGLRTLEKAAVAAGGATNHRKGLWDAAMIKDNHLTLLGPGGDIFGAIRRLKKRRLHVTVEAKTNAEALQVCLSRANRVLLDNFPIAVLAKTIPSIRRHFPRLEIEISGGVRLHNVASLAKLRPDFISVGALTHSAPALDLSMDVEPL